jgi:hypothetical protein
MKSTAALFLLPVTLIALAGCSDPVDEPAWTTYKHFATCVHTAQFEEARGMLQYHAPAGWQPRIGGPPAPSKHFKFKAAEFDRQSASASGDSLTLVTDVTLVYSDKRDTPEVLYYFLFGGGDWFAPDEKLHYTHHATMTKVDGVWKVTDVQITPKD